jgi:hypothetical protein
MIKIEKNGNFRGFFNVFAFGKLIEQVQGRARAVSLASDLAKQNRQTHFMGYSKKIIEVSK